MIILISLCYSSEAMADHIQRSPSDQDDWTHVPALTLLGPAPDLDEPLDEDEPVTDHAAEEAKWRAPLEVTASRIKDAMAKAGVDVTWEWSEPEDDAPHILVAIHEEPFIIVTSRWVNDSGGYTGEAAIALDMAWRLGVFDWAIGEP